MRASLLRCVHGADTRDVNVVKIAGIDEKTDTGVVILANRLLDELVSIK